MRVLVLGCGKRFINVYFAILKKLGHEMFLWNRTREKSEAFCKKEGIFLVENLNDALEIKPDVVLCFIPPGVQYEIIRDLQVDCTILVETPAEDQKLLSLSKNLGVLEQWPLLPLEQFKNKIYESGLISRPYLTFNDGRSFDYHAISQLRTYMNHPLPATAKGSIKSYPNGGVVDSSEKLNSSPFEWTMGQLEMSNGGLLQYSFSYNCKSLLSIPIQFIRSYSIDGSIVTGRMKEIGNDYEYVDVRCLNKATRQVEICNVVIDRNEGVTHSVSMKDKNVEWNNPYASLDFDDQQTAIATLVDNAMNGEIYSYQNAYVDFMCINLIKMSAFQQRVINVR